MSGVKKELRWTPFLFLFYRDVFRFFKVWIQTIVAPLISQALYILIFGVSLGAVVKISEDFSYLGFLIPGLVAMSALNQSFQNGASSIFSMKITGEIIDIKSTALNMPQIIIAIGLSGLLRGLLVSSLTLTLGQIVHFFMEGSLLSIAHPFLLYFFLFLGGVVFALLGFIVGVFSKTFDHIGAISGFLLMPLIYLGGVFYDLDTLSPFWQKLSLLNPVFYFISGIRHCVLGISDVSIWLSFSFMIFSVFLACFLAWMSSFKGTFQRAF